MQRFACLAIIIFCCPKGAAGAGDIATCRNTTDLFFNLISSLLNRRWAFLKSSCERHVNYSIVC